MVCVPPQVEPPCFSVGVADAGRSSAKRRRAPVVARREDLLSPGAKLRLGEARIGGVRHAERAADALLDLVPDVGEHPARNALRACRPSRPANAPRCQRPMPSAVPGRMKIHPVDAVAEPVVRFQLRRVPVGEARQLVRGLVTGMRAGRVALSFTHGAYWSVNDTSSRSSLKAFSRWPAWLVQNLVRHASGGDLAHAVLPILRLCFLWLGDDRRQPSAISSIRRCARRIGGRFRASGPTSASMKAPTTQAPAMRGSQSRKVPAPGRCGSGARTPRPALPADEAGLVDSLARLDDHGMRQPAALQRTIAEPHGPAQTCRRRTVTIRDGSQHIALAAGDDGQHLGEQLGLGGSSGRRCRWRHGLLGHRGDVRMPPTPSATRPRAAAGCAGCPLGGLRQKGCR